jgi:hypothetical protein
MGRCRVLLVVLLVMLMVPGAVVAQDSEEGTTSGTRMVAPDDCVTEPRAHEEIIAILALEEDGVPPPALIHITPPLGELADAETATAIRDGVRQIIACFNAGDIPRAASVMTEAGVRRVYWGLTIDQENRALARQRIPAPPERRADAFLIRLITITDVSVLPDGRIAAFVVMNEPLLPPGGPETLLFVFANQDGQWLLDDLIDFSIVSMIPEEEGTPAS